MHEPDHRNPPPADPQGMPAQGPRLLQFPVASAQEVAQALRDGLAADRPHIPPWYLYDELGSHLFAAITALPEYYPTRTEAAIYSRHLREIARSIGPPGGTLIDLGAGNGEKAARLFDALRPARYVAVDISVDYLRASLTALAQRHPGIRMTGVGTDFSEKLQLPPDLPAGQRLFFYPGSSIGNFDPTQARALLGQVQAQLGTDGALLIGVDLRKPRDILLAAYDDALGVTAAFNRNVLRHVNALAGTDFELREWSHRVHYDDAAGRIEMHLQAQRDLIVRWPGGERSFSRGACIHTENAYKYTLDGVERLLMQSGLSASAFWTDPSGWFSVFLARRRS